MLSLRFEWHKLAFWFNKCDGINSTVRVSLLLSASLPHFESLRASYNAWDWQLLLSRCYINPKQGQTMIRNYQIFISINTNIYSPRAVRSSSKANYDVDDWTSVEP